jgi:hypothetical protein
VDRDGRLQMDEIYITSVAGESKIISVRE